MGTMTNITDQLPYELSGDVIADIDGIITTKTYGTLLIGDFDEWEYEYEGDTGWGLIPWITVSQTLRYKPSDPAVIFVEDDRVVYWWLQGAKDGFTYTKKIWRLHRNACLLFDNAEGFMVLYQCIKEFGDGQNGRED